MSLFKGKPFKPSKTIDRAKAVSYLAELHKTAGNGKPVLPSVFTTAVCDVCDGYFVKVFDTWAMRLNGRIVSKEEAKIHVEAFELSPTVKHGICNIAAYVKWDLIHQKLKQLNETEAA